MKVGLCKGVPGGGESGKILAHAPSLSHEVRGAKEGHLLLLPTRYGLL